MLTRFRLLCLLLLLALFALPALGHPAHKATCTGSAHCRACKNCKYCKHCSKQGGTCSVCTTSARRVVASNQRREGTKTTTLKKR